jgi:DNA repair exonuclease SbcCD ATPase subunit
MTGVNIFGTGINSTPISQLRGPPGIGFRYLDAEKNFDLNNRRLANISCPIEDKDAACKTYVDEEVAKVSDVHVKDSEMINKKIDVVREGVMVHINFLEKELPAVKSIVETLDGKVSQEMTDLDKKVTQEMIEVKTELENLGMKLTQEMTEVRSKLRKQMNNLKSLDEKVSSLAGIQVELKAYIDGVETRVDGNMNKVAEVLRKQDEFSERLAKVEDIETGVR